jgi:hypothetical protein
MEEVQKIVYDPEKDVKFKERIELSKNVFFSAFGKVLFIVRWLLFIGGFISLLSFTGVLIPVVMVAWVIIIVVCILLIGIFSVFYLPGSFIAAVMTLLDPQNGLLETETVATSFTKVLVNSAMSWYYVEIELLGAPTYSKYIFT